MAIDGGEHRVLHAGFRESVRKAFFRLAPALLFEEVEEMGFFHF